MAARKKTTRKKTAAKKTPKKKAAKRKAAPRKKKAAKKKSTKKKATKKRATAKRATKKRATKSASGKKGKPSLAARTRKAIDDNLRSLERELPRHLKSMIKDIRQGIAELEDQIEKARGDGERRWNDLEKQVRQDSEKMLKRFGLGSKKKPGTKQRSRR